MWNIWTEHRNKEVDYMQKGYINLDIIERYKEVVFEEKNVMVKSLSDFPGKKEINIPLPTKELKGIINFNVLK